MKIEKNKVVTFHYVLSEQEGGVIEDSKNSDPMLYLHGHNNLMPALEVEMQDKQVGDSFKASLSPEQAYGVRDENAKQRVPIKHLMVKNPKKLKPGMAVKINTAQGAKDAVVLKVGKFNVDLDTNHPLAGKSLCFDVEVIDVREATGEEASHGHAHGVGGHQH